MLHFNLEKPIALNWVGEFVSPAEGWKHLSRVLVDYELMIVTDGTLYIGDDKEEYCVKTGEYLVMPPTRLQHGTRVCACRFYWMHFTCPALPASVSLPKHGKYTDGERIAQLVRLLFDAEMRRRCGLQSHSLATSILIELAVQSEGTENQAVPDAKHRLCAQVKNYIEWQRFSSLRVRDIARELGYHEKYISSVFHETEGIPLKRYLDGRRVREAKRLLLETDNTVAEVAYDLGFESPHNFSRFFKNEEGVSPHEFRSKAEKE